MKKQRSITNQNLDIEIIEKTIHDNIDVYYETEEREKTSIIMGELEKMKEEDKKIFISYYYFSKKIKDISKEFNISEVKVKSRLSRIRKKLKKELEKRGYDETVDSYYMVKTKWGYEEGLMVQLNANAGEFIAFNDMDLKYKHLDSQILDDEEIRKISTDIYNKLGIEKNKYILSKTTAQDYYFESQANKLLGANFYKYYDGIANKNESLNISFMYYNGEIYLNSVLINKDDTYQNNPVVITKEEAINIAKNKEQELNPYEITNVTSSLSIEKMNAFIYQIENDKYDVTGSTEDEIYYETEDITRKVWRIKVEHNVDARNYSEDYNKYIKEGMNKIYFVDATTGEIIGGTYTFLED